MDDCMRVDDFIFFFCVKVCMRQPLQFLSGSIFRPSYEDTGTLPQPGHEPHLSCKQRIGYGIGAVAKGEYMA